MQPLLMSESSAASVSTASLFSFSFLLSDRFRGSSGGSWGLKGWLCHGRSSLESLVTKKSRISSPPTPLYSYWITLNCDMSHKQIFILLKPWDHGIALHNSYHFLCPIEGTYGLVENKINTENYNTNWKVSYIYHVRDEEELLFLWENQGRFCQKRC